MLHKPKEMKILITGGNGYIGKSVYNYFTKNKEHDITVISRSSLDLTDDIKVKEFFESNYFDVVIHTAASGGSRLVPDNADVLLNNVKSFYNLYDNRTRFKKLISFGSGAEFSNGSSPYGLSKRCINSQISKTTNFYNLRIYAVFDENELPTRFIKNSITKSILGENIIIHQNKVMDFIYMKDLISIIEHYCEEDVRFLDKNLNCCYNEKLSLVQIAKYISSKNNFKSNIVVQTEGLGTPYASLHNTYIPCKLKGLFVGIDETYDKMKVVL